MTEPRPVGCTSPCIACMTGESHDPTPPPLSPCRRIDRHNSHVHEVYRRPFLCPGVTERAETEDQPTLRETIRLTIARQHLQDVGSDRTVEDLDDAEFADDADAVMAVLPAPADYWRAKLHAVTAGRDGLKRENMRLERELAHIERIRENADFHLGQEMARRQLAEKEAAQLRTDRAAILRDAADRLDRLGLRDLATRELRRMADEAETGGPQ
ncbi:hypothetical protein ACFU9O_02490 [Streptomyces albidoflavus]